MPHLTAVQPQPLEITRSPRGDGAVWIEACGELDVCGAPDLAFALRDALTGSPLVVLDLRELTFIDSAGVHVIVDATRDALLHGGRLLIAFAQEPVSAVFRLTGNAHVVEACEHDVGLVTSVR